MAGHYIGKILMKMLCKRFKLLFNDIAMLIWRLSPFQHLASFPLYAHTIKGVNT